MSDNLEMSDDFLSTCPLLIDILRLIDYKDIPNTKLVSRRLYNVIMKHGLLLARSIMNLEIVTENQKVIDTDFIYICYRMPDNTFTKCRVYITDQRLRIMDHPEWISNSLRANGFPILDGTEKGNFESTLKQVLGSVTYSRYQDFGINSLEEGLECVLSLLFRRFHFNNIFLIDHIAMKEGDRAVGWIAMMRRQFKKSLSKCEVLYINDLNGFQDLHSTLDCGLALRNASLDLAHYLDTQRLDRALRIYVHPETLLSLHPLLVLIRRWIAGETHIKDLRILCKKYDQHFNITNRMVVQKLMPLKPVSSHTSFIDHHNYPVEFVFERATDRKYLNLIYCQTHRFFIREVRSRRTGLVPLS